LTLAPQLLRDEVLHIIALGQGRYGWHAIATRLSDKEVPRTPTLMDVLRELRERGLAQTVEDAEGKTPWRLTATGSAALSARPSPPSSGTFAREVRRVAQWLHDAPEGHAAPLHDQPPTLEFEPTPDESAWLAILHKDADFAVRSNMNSRSSPKLSPAVGKALREHRNRAVETADWRSFIKTLRGIQGLPPSINLYSRGRAWHALGFESLAAALYRHAQRLDPRNHRIGILRLNATSSCSPRPSGPRRPAP
jgi:hypothetical protein